jgi:small GTP-binding protein
MIQKKICLIGAFAVGKTSLVQRFVQSLFSEKYHTTIGVKIDKKIVTIGDSEVTLVLWDLAGQDEFKAVDIGYLRGSSGYLLVADGTRRATLDCALDLHARAQSVVGAVPFRILINKTDLEPDWEVTEEDLTKITERGWPVGKTSARTGDNVEAAFLSLTQEMIHAQ